MRLALLAVLAAGLFSAEVAVAAPCASPIDQGAFDTAALKSELMVVALTCNARTQYNQFVMQFRPDLAREERALDSWFSRAYGRRARPAPADDITHQANAASPVGLRRGTLFCSEHASLFPTVLRLRGPAQLVGFASHRMQPQPIVLVSCAQRRPAVVPSRRVVKTAKAGR